MKIQPVFLAFLFAALPLAAKQKMPSQWFSGRLAEVHTDRREIQVQRMDAPIAMSFQLASNIEIYRKGKELAPEDLRPGDIMTVFYEEEGVAIHIEVFPPKTKKKG
jgi:hypothetical protein